MRALLRAGPLGSLRPLSTLPRWRLALALPYVLALLLALVLGPGTIDSAHGSFAWLVVASVGTAALSLVVRGALLIPVGLTVLVAFPPSAGLGFNFAPQWARPLVALVFYGAIVSSAVTILLGSALAIRSRVRGHPRIITDAAVCLVALGAVIGSPSQKPVAAYAGTPAVTGAPVNMGPVINSTRREAEPSFTADGRTMYFNCDDYDICVSHLSGPWGDGRWSVPLRLAEPISTDYFEVEPWITPAGEKLYFNSSRPFARTASLPGLSLYVDAVGLIGMVLGTDLFGGLGQDEIWVSYLRDGVWSEPVNLRDIPGEPPVNTDYADHCLAFSADDNEAFWTSTRPGGFGGNDIWTSSRVDGAWTPARNLGRTVNGPSGEHHSMPSPDGRSLYVTSDRAGGFGGEDLYVTARGDDGAWSLLTNMGPRLNGAANDRCATWTPDGRIFIFDSDRTGGAGSIDLWWVYFSDLR